MLQERVEGKWLAAFRRAFALNGTEETSRSNAWQRHLAVTGYPGTADRMPLERPTGCVGMRNSGA
jgi:hypothetical protein